MKFYRYEDTQFEDGPHIQEYEFTLVRETTNGWWIDTIPGCIGFLYKPKWISKTSRKRFAYLSKEEALEGFRARKLRQIEILRYRLDRAERSLVLAGGQVPTDWYSISSQLIRRR